MKYLHQLRKNLSHEYILGLKTWYIIWASKYFIIHYSLNWAQCRTSNSTTRNETFMYKY